MKKLFFLVMVTVLSSLSVRCADIQKEKRQEIEKMLRLTGMENLMGQMKTQMVASLKSQTGEVMPEEFWSKLQQKMDIRELIEKIIPIYDKYYTLDDLKAINAFYGSPAGQKVLANLPKVMQESMKVGQEWGERIGRQAADEVQQELKQKGQK